MVALRWFLFLILALNTTVGQQVGTEQKIRCTIEVAKGEWNRNAPASITGTIENASGHPLDAEVTPTIYLSHVGFPSEDRYWAPVDVLNDRPLALDTRSIDPKGEAVAIRPKAIHLSFKKQSDSIPFRIDAKHLLWDRTISSVWPSMKLFGIVEPGEYYVRLVLESERSESQSNRVRVVISSEPEKATFLK